MCRGDGVNWNREGSRVGKEWKRSQMTTDDKNIDVDNRYYSDRKANLNGPSIETLRGWLMNIRKNRLYTASGVEDLRDVALYDLLQGLCPRRILPEMIGPHRHRRFLLCPAPGGYTMMYSYSPYMMSIRQTQALYVVTHLLRLFIHFRIVSSSPPKDCLPRIRTCSYYTA